MPSDDEQIRIFEVAPRDGLQNEDEALSVTQKVQLIEKLAKSGLNDIEVGSFVHPKWVPQMAQTGNVYRQLPSLKKVRYWALVPNQTGFEHALEAGVEHIATFMSASETHNQKNVNRSIDESLTNIEGILNEASTNIKASRAYISTVFGCPFEGDIDFDRVMQLTEKLIKAGADIVSLGDTIGVGTPLQVRECVRQLLDHFDRDQIALHFHDTQGMALTNIFVAWEEGIRQFDSSAGGLGGCPYAPGAAGNVGTEDTLHLFESLESSTGVDLDQVVEATRWIEDETPFEITSRYYQYHTANQ